MVGSYTDVAVVKRPQDLKFGYNVIDIQLKDKKQRQSGQNRAREWEKHEKGNPRAMIMDLESRDEIEAYGTLLKL
ncbi:hypothetical protein Tco_0498748 [Tanacetum coccineum]